MPPEIWGLTSRSLQGRRTPDGSVYAEWRRPGSDRPTLAYRAMRPLPVLTGVRRKKGGVAAQAIGSFSGPPGRKTVHCPPRCSLVITTAEPQNDHRHIHGLSRTKKSRSHSEPVEVRADPVGPKRAACACQFAKLCPFIKPDGQSAGTTCCYR